MPIDQSDKLARAEDAIAFACWSAFHLFRPCPRDSHHLCDCIPWRADVEHFDDGAGPLFLKEPDTYDEVSKEVVDKFEQLGPGALDNAARYCFFEFCTNPALTDTEALLDRLAEEFQRGDRLLPEAQGRAFAFGRFTVGPLGVIERKNATNGFSYFCGNENTANLYQYARAIEQNDHSGISFNKNDVFDFECIGWSARWKEWVAGQRFAVTGEEPERYSAFLYFRNRWHPSDDRLNTSESLNDWEIHAAPSAIAGIQNRDDLQRILSLCLESSRESFFKDVDWSRAPRARTAVAKATFAELDMASLQQLLLSAPPRLVISCLNDVLPRLKPPFKTECFSVNLAQLLIKAYESIDNLQRLEILTAQTGGDFFDRVLHYVLRRDPETVLRRQLDQPEIASAIAALTCCSYKYHDADWDFSDPDLAETLVSEVKNALGFVQATVAPNVGERALPLSLSAKPGDTESARNMVNQGRRRAEWIVKTAIQYAFALDQFISTENTIAPTGWPQRYPVFCPSDFFSDQPFRHRVEANVKNSEGQAMQIPTNGKMTIHPLMSLMNALGSVLENPESEVLGEVLREQNKLFGKLNQLKIPSLGNLGSHDNPCSLDELLTALQVMVEFDSVARNELRALPIFMLFKQQQCTPNRPTEVHFEVATDVIPVPADDVRCEHYFTKEYGFSADRFYSVTDITRNAISLNPIVLDWTDWLTT